MNEGGRWYDPRTGKSCHTLPKKDGTGNKNTTLREGKELGLYPSITTVLKVLAKPELDRWKQLQVATASLTLPRHDGETDEDFINRIIVDAFTQVDDAALLGSNIHQALEFHFQGRKYDPSLSVYVNAVDEWIKNNGITFLKHETRVFDHDLGVAGTFDALCLQNGEKIIGDFKSRKTKPGMPCKPWNTEPMQISAYASPLQAARGFNLFISTTEPGRCEGTFYDHSRLKKEHEAFRSVVALYRHINNFPHNPNLTDTQMFANLVTK